MIGVGIVTYNRFNRFKECFENLMKNSESVDEILIVDDCSDIDRDKYNEYFDQIRLNNVKIIINEKNLGVGKSKNKILKYFYNKNFDFVFTIEDDINVISPNVFNKYIEAHKKTDIHHFNFAWHGPANSNNENVCKKIVINDFEIQVCPHIVGAFSFYTRELIEQVGYFDEIFLNAWEHVDYTYRCSEKFMTTPFWSFADIVDSRQLLKEQENSINDSAIRPRKDWSDNIKFGLKYWETKHGKPLFSEK